MSDDGWEARMVEKAVARSVVRAAEEITARAAREAEPAVDVIDRFIDSFPMTVKQARAAAASPAYGCACTGPPVPIAYLDGAPCWCAVIAEKIRRLLEAADG